MIVIALGTLEEVANFLKTPLDIRTASRVLHLDPIKGLCFGDMTLTAEQAVLLLELLNLDPPSYAREKRRIRWEPLRLAFDEPE